MPDKSRVGFNTNGTARLGKNKSGATVFQRYSETYGTTKKWSQYEDLGAFMKAGLKKPVAKPAVAPVATPKAKPESTNAVPSEVRSVGAGKLNVYPNGRAALVNDTRVGNLGADDKVRYKGGDILDVSPNAPGNRGGPAPVKMGPTAKQQVELDTNSTPEMQKLIKKTGGTGVPVGLPITERQVQSTAPTPSNKGSVPVGAGTITKPQPVAGKTSAAKTGSIPTPTFRAGVFHDGSKMYHDENNRDGKYGNSTSNYPDALKGLDDGSSTFLRGNDPSNPYAKQGLDVIKDKAGRYYQDDRLAKPVTPTLNSPLGDGTGSPVGELKTVPWESSVKNGVDVGVEEAAKTGMDFGNIGKYAGVANNIMRSLQKAPDIKENYLNPDLMKYTDRSAGLRRASEGGMRADVSNARNTSGGSAGNMRANAAGASVANQSRQVGIDTNEQSRADQIDNANVGIKNQAKQINLTRQDAYQEQRTAAQGAKENYGNQAAADISKFAQANEQMDYMKSRDAKQDAMDEKRMNNANGASETWAIAPDGSWAPKSATALSNRLAKQRALAGFKLGVGSK